MTGAEGVSGCSFMTTAADSVEMHPAAFLTVNVCVPEVIPVIVLEVPVPVTVAPAGRRVIVHVPVAGNPLKTTLPVETLHVGWVIAPITGGVGVSG